MSRHARNSVRQTSIAIAVSSAVAIILLAVPILSQATKRPARPDKPRKAVEAAATPKTELMQSLDRSKRARSISRTIDGTIQGKRVDALFEYVAPDRFYLRETFVGAPRKEAIEIRGERYQKQKTTEEWVKVTDDPAPLRTQFADSFFPLAFSSKRSDAIKIKKTSVSFVGESEQNGVKYGTYRYSILYSGIDVVDSGVAWVNRKSGLLEHVEYDGVGLFGSFKSKWLFDYEKLVTIEAPKAFVEKNWID